LPPLEMRRRSALDELRRCHRPHVLQADETLDLEIPVERALDCRRRSNTARYRLQKVEGHALRPAARAVVKRSRRLSCAPVNAKLTARNWRAVCILDCVRMATGRRMPTRRLPPDSASERSGESVKDGACALPGPVPAVENPLCGRGEDAPNRFSPRCVFLALGNVRLRAKLAPS
jgi:hypothetical protein